VYLQLIKNLFDLFSMLLLPYKNFDLFILVEEKYWMRANFKVVKEAS